MKKLEIGDSVVNVLVEIILDRFEQFNREREFEDKFDEFFKNNHDFACEHEELLESNKIFKLFDRVLDIIGIPETGSYPHLYEIDNSGFDINGYYHIDINDSNLLAESFEDGFDRDWFYEKFMDIEFRYNSIHNKSKPDDILELNEVIMMTINEMIEIRTSVEDEIKQLQIDYDKDKEE